MKRLFLFILVLISINSWGQLNNPKEIKLNKNAIYGGVNLIGFYKTFTVSYERTLWRRNMKGNVSTFTKFSIYKYFRIGHDDSLMNIGAKYGLLIGNKNLRLEIASGLSAYFEDNDTYLYISSNLGMRVHKPGGKLVFRLGGGWPDYAYIGLGFSF